MAGQEGDILLEQTNDDGEITVTNGLIQMTGGFETAAYLSLFGGNEDDDGLDASKTWWANKTETEGSKKYISRTQNLLKALPATSGNLLKIEEAVKIDLQWFLDNNIASSVTVQVTIPTLNRVKITITIEARGEESQFEFTENWQAMASGGI